MSFKPEVSTDASGKFYGNNLRFATAAEAEQSASDMATRWLLVREWRVTESEDPVNWRLTNDGLLPVARRV